MYGCKCVYSIHILHLFHIHSLESSRFRSTRIVVKKRKEETGQSTGEWKDRKF